MEDMLIDPKIVENVADYKEETLTNKAKITQFKALLSIGKQYLLLRSIANGIYDWETSKGQVKALLVELMEGTNEPMIRQQMEVVEASLQLYPDLIDQQKVQASMVWLHNFLDLKTKEDFEEVEVEKKVFAETKDFSSFMLSVFRRKFETLDVENNKE